MILKLWKESNKTEIGKEARQRSYQIINEILDDLNMKSSFCRVLGFVKVTG